MNLCCRFQVLKLVCLLILVIATSLSSAFLLAGVSERVNAITSQAFVINQDYRQIAAEQLSTQTEPLADITFFYWYGSEASRQVELALADYMQPQTSITLERVPLVAYFNWRPQAYLQPMLEQLKVSMALPSSNDIYQACITDCSIFKDYQSVKSWLMTQVNLDNFEFDESQVWQSEKNYRKKAESFSISQVPTMLIKGTYIVDADSAKSPERLIKILDFLLNKAKQGTTKTDTQKINDE